MCNILCVIFQTVVLIFIVASCNTTFFRCCILRASSGIPCLSGYENDSNLKFDCSSNKAFKKYEIAIQIMTSLFFPSINLRRIRKSFSRSVMR